jgi:hypothetical protein
MFTNKQRNKETKKERKKQRNKETKKERKKQTNRVTNKGLGCWSLYIVST